VNLDECISLLPWDLQFVGEKGNISRVGKGAQHSKMNRTGFPNLKNKEKYNLGQANWIRLHVQVR